jgi:hypothetical protein
VDCLGRWILEFGWTTYPGMKGILLLCDSGDSNGYRPRVWKYGNTAATKPLPESTALSLPCATVPLVPASGILSSIACSVSSAWSGPATRSDLYS